MASLPDNNCLQWNAGSLIMAPKKIVGHGWPASSQLSFLSVLFMCGYAFLKAQLAVKKTEKSCLETRVPFASCWSTIDVRCSCFLFSVSVITRSFKEHQCGFSKGIRPVCRVWKQSGGVHDLNPTTLCLFLFCLLADCSSQIKWGSCICFQLWLNANDHATSIIRLTWKADCKLIIRLYIAVVWTG